MQERINEDIKKAMLAKDATKLGVLRMVKTSLINLEKERKTRLEDADFISTFRKAIKTRQDSVVAFTDANRKDLADKEHAEIAILESYLPAKMSAEELDSLVKAAVADSGASSKKQMGAAMKLATERAAGRVDGRTISTLIGKLLD